MILLSLIFGWIMIDPKKWWKIANNCKWWFELLERKQWNWINFL